MLAGPFAQATVVWLFPGQSAESLAEWVVGTAEWPFRLPGTVTRTTQSYLPVQSDYSDFQPGFMSLITFD